MVIIACQVKLTRSRPVNTGPATSPMFPPTPWKDSTDALRCVKWDDKAATAGKCQTDAATATIAIPINSSA